MPPAGVHRFVDAAGIVVGGIAALTIAWLVLVTLRSGAPVPAGVDLPDRLDAGIAQTLVADRVLAVAAWAGYVSTTLVLGGLVFERFVAPVGTPAGGRHRSPSGAPGRSRRPAADSRSGGSGLERHRSSRRPAGGPRTGRPRPAAGGPVLRAAIVLGLVAVAVSLPLRGVVVSGRGFAALTDPGPLTFALTSPFGDAALVRAAGLGLVAASRVSGPLRTVAAVGGATVLLASYLLVGHPQANHPVALEVAAHAVHVTAVSVWFGGIVFLAAELRRQRRSSSVRASSRVVSRFSRLAEAMVVLVLCSGAVLTGGQVALTTPFWQTAYGRALVAKLAFVAVVLAIGGYNRQRVVPAIAKRDEVAAWRRLGFTCAAEAVVIALGVLLMTAAMTSGGL